MENSSDWIAQTRSARSGTPDWIKALEEHGQTGGGFSDLSPFADISANPAAPSPSSDPVSAREEDAISVAYQEGFVAGEAQARQAADAQVEEHKGRLRDLRLSFRTLDQAARDALAQDLNETVLSLCRQVLGQYALDEAALVARCEAAAARLGGGASQLTLHVHPDVASGLSPEISDNWTIKEDPSLEQGGLRLTSQEGAVHDGPADWMRAVAQALSE